MKVIFLGTNGWFDTVTGNTICTLIQAKEFNLFLDAGYGISKADRFLNAQKPTSIFLSHLHLDHIIGIHTLARFRFKKSLKIYVPAGLIADLKKLIDQPFTVPPKSLPFKIEIIPAKSKFELPGVKIFSLELEHSSQCLGYRFEIGKKVITYCTDTGRCASFIKLAQGADLLITECALKKGQHHGGWPHLDPLDAAKLAKEAGVKKLVLTHFDANNYKNLPERKIAQSQAKKAFFQSMAAYDGSILNI